MGKKVQIQNGGDLCEAVVPFPSLGLDENNLVITKG